MDLHQAFEVLGSLGARLYVTPEAKLAFCVKDLKAWSDKEAVDAGDQEVGGYVDYRVLVP